ncbi:MAG: nucleotidyltransferase domain-containing protein, partial [Pseudomonadota bacterium]
MALVSKRADLAADSLADSAANREAQRLFKIHGYDEARTFCKATKAAETAQGAVEKRRAIVEVLGAAISDARASITAHFAKHPKRSRDITTAFSNVTDVTVRLARDLAQTHLLAAPLRPDENAQMAILAVGGYGRGEMAPHSDVDLLFLTPPGTEPDCERLVEAMLYVLWDLKLKVGHATRSVRDCLRLAREDYTIRTSLVEMRLLGGSEALFQDLQRRLWAELFKSTARDFIEAKL